MFASLLAGLILTAATIAVHAGGTAWYIARTRRKHAMRMAPVSRVRVFRVLLFAAVTLLTLHLVEVSIWAAVYVFLPGETGVTTFEDAVYFSTVTFTTLGYGDITLSGGWRMLSAIQAAVGLLIFGWSTAILIAIVQSIWGGERVSRERSDE